MVRGVFMATWLLVHSTISLFPAAPDLLVWGPSARPYVGYLTFDPNSCEVREGCVAAGRRRVLRFETESRNAGTADLVFGNPVLNPRFVYDPCHNHYHFGEFAQYRLLDPAGALVVQGKKIGFCLEDTVRWDNNAGPNPIYNCLYQGIQRGWADRYTYNVPCQLLDVTDVPAGTYILDITVDPSEIIPELDESNNNVRLIVEIPPPECTTPPPNDAFASAEIINTVPQIIYGENACATKETGERNHAGNTGGRSVWYRWSAAFTREIVISTEGSSFDTLLAVYRDSGGNLALVAENNDVAPGVIEHSEVRFQAAAGTEYRIVVDGFDGGFGSIVLNVDPPGNDDFASCQTIAGASGSMIGHNIGATREAGEPTHAATFGTHSVWYCWTAPRAGTMEWSTMGSDFDTTLAVYTGSSLSQLTPIASDNDSGSGGTSIVRLNAISNTVYRIAVDGRGNAMGNLTLGWEFLAASLRIDRNSVGTLTLTLRGANGTYNLNASSTLTNWGQAGTITVTNGRGSITQPNDTAHRFYRAVLPAP